MFAMQKVLRIRIRKNIQQTLSYYDFLTFIKCRARNSYFQCAGSVTFRYGLRIRRSQNCRNQGFSNFFLLANGRIRIREAQKFLDLPDREHYLTGVVDLDPQGSASFCHLITWIRIRIRIKIYKQDPEPHQYADVRTKYIDCEPMFALFQGF